MIDISDIMPPLPEKFDDSQKSSLFTSQKQAMYKNAATPYHMADYRYLYILLQIMLFYHPNATPWSRPFADYYIIIFVDVSFRVISMRAAYKSRAPPRHVPPL